MSQELKEIEAISGSQFCGKGNVIDLALVGDLNAVRTGSRDGSSPKPRKSAAEIRQAILASFPSNQAPCIDLGRWPERELQTEPNRLNKTTGFVVIGDHKIPLIVTRLAQNEIRGQGFAGRVFVRLCGGPGGIPFGAMSDYVIPLAENDLIIDFLYTGSGTNLIYPGANFGTAVAQVRTFVESLRRRNRAAEIVLVGESLGARIGLAAMAKETWQGTAAPVDRMILISPVARSAQSFFDVSNEMARQVDPNSLFEMYRIVRPEGDDWSTRTIRRLNRIDVLGKFFPKDALNDTIVDSVSRVPDLPMLVMYGDRDPIIGLVEIEALRGTPSVTLETIHGMQHSITILGHLHEMRYVTGLFLE